MSLSDRARKIFATQPVVRVPPVIDSSGAAFNGPFIGPGSPIPAVEPTAEPRGYDYTSGVNSSIIPRTEYPNLPNFYELWVAYLASDLARVCVTFRKQQIQSLTWRIVNKKGSGFRTGRADEARRLFELPDPQLDMNFEAWLGAALEEIYVTDALTIYPRRNRLNRIVAFELIDGSTIKPLIDYARGGTPAPPFAGFSQIIKGSVYASFTSEELIYKKFRPRVWCIYGQPRMENILSPAALQAIHEAFVQSYYTQGNLTEQIALTDPTVIDATNEEQVVALQATMDVSAGQNPGRRRIHVMPPFIKSVSALKNEIGFNKELSDWDVRKFCIEFGVPTHLFISETNRATAREMNSVLNEAPFRADIMAFKRTCDMLLSRCGFVDSEFIFDQNLDFSMEAVEGIAKLVEVGVMQPDEAAEHYGLLRQIDAGLSPEGDEQSSEGDAGSEAGAAGAQADDTKASPARLSSEDAGAVQKSTRLPTVRGKKGRRFTGPGSVKRATLASGLAEPIYKQLRKKQSSIMVEAVAEARRRGRVVVNA